MNVAPQVEAAARFAPGGLGFRPGWWPTVLLLALLPVFLSLADWQWQKAERKAAAQARLDGLAGEPPVSLPARAIADVERLAVRPVSAAGEYLAEGQILIDNQIRNGRPGVSVLTPLRITGGDRVVLVDRGWIALPADRRMPQPGVPAGPITLTGTAYLPPQQVFRLAEETAPAGGNAPWQNIDLARYEALSGLPLHPLVVRLSPDAADGFRRDWPRPDDRIERHRSYALQWVGFALAATMIWFWHGLRRGQRKERP